ncbi:MAG TPA: carboxymuconolactone decarboxylase family protein [Rubellimicrobium sp.]|nr:carboxymuconolactone decarboxylase family protein [Rubellimicrobium sp.]
MKWLLAIAMAAFIPQLAVAQDEAQDPGQAPAMTADEARTAVREAMGVELPDIENYPDSMVAGAWAWMQDVEDGQGALDLKTMQLIGLAVASQIPCQYCIHYHRQAATAAGASEQELAEAAAMAGYVRNWSTVLYGTEADVDAYHAMVDGLFASQN